MPQSPSLPYEACMDPAAFAYTWPALQLHKDLDMPNAARHVTFTCGWPADRGGVRGADMAVVGVPASSAMMRYMSRCLASCPIIVCIQASSAGKWG